ncbi:uncharacterized protein LOC115757891 [Drosophila novamexicana]|uniref:uncharacterized protein LOC115757891 n=1 Tax=Drosophila novamexicana TaxID=47314 RepID=UPI0011E603EA|nr:uncharacterized protein LOC115757891 [Drosophila novamexicana]
MFSKCLVIYQSKLPYSSRKLHHQNKSKAQMAQIKSNMMQQRREPNPEYHHAPSSFVQNFINHHQQGKTKDAQLHHWNARYRWADFRRRMIYGTHDI